MAQVPVQQQQQQQQPGQPGGGGVQLPPLVPNTLDDHGLMDSSWFKVVITKCPSGKSYKCIVSIGSIIAMSDFIAMSRL